MMLCKFVFNREDIHDRKNYKPIFRYIFTELFLYIFTELFRYIFIESFLYFPGKHNLSAAQYQQAIKFCKFAGSALQYEDNDTAIDNLNKALKLLTTGQSS